MKGGHHAWHDRFEREFESGALGGRQCYRCHDNGGRVNTVVGGDGDNR